MKLLFPTIIHHVKVNNFKFIQDELVNFAYQERERDPIGVKKSNKGGWQSQPTYKDYNNILLSTIQQTIGPYFGNGVFNNTTQLVFDGLWININGKGDHNSSHNHPNCNLAGVMWIKASKELDDTGKSLSGDIEFLSPHNFTSAGELIAYNDEFCDKCDSWPAYWIRPEEGMILIFPASIMHKVYTNETNQDRISASFNLHIR